MKKSSSALPASRAEITAARRAQKRSRATRRGPPRAPSSSVEGILIDPVEATAHEQEGGSVRPVEPGADLLPVERPLDREEPGADVLIEESGLGIRVRARRHHERALLGIDFDVV